MKPPVYALVPSPSSAFPAMRFTLRERGDAEKRIRVLLSNIAEIEALDELTPSLLLRAMHWHHAVDALLDGLLEVIRREQDREVEQAWWGEIPAWPQEAAESSEGAAAA